VDMNHLFDDLRPQNRGIRLLCPAVVNISATDDRSTLTSVVDTLHKICVRANRNIAARASQEHIYEMDGETFQILSGPGSAMHFRMNFIKRLGEVFKNLDHILGDGPADQTWLAEFQVFDSLFQVLKTLDGYSPLPQFVTVPYGLLKAKLANGSTADARE
jgi:hypothetical protein